MTLTENSFEEIKKINSISKNRDIVFVSGTFNIVHPGHLRLLRFAAECGNFLVVGVLSDSLAKGAQLESKTRIDGVDAISWVDYTFCLEDSPAEFISSLKPSAVVKGNEHENTENLEYDAVSSYGGRLLFGSGGTTFSSLELLRRETEFVDHSSIIKPEGFLSRHEIDLSETDKVLSQMNSLNVCVVGDTIVDEYIQCDPLGMSQEDPTIVVTPIMENRRGRRILLPCKRHWAEKYFLLLLATTTVLYKKNK